MSSSTPSFKVGDKVYFGRTHGEKTLGEIVKVNRAKYKIKQLEERGSILDYKIGTVWTVPFNLVTAGPGTVAAPVVQSAPAVAAKPPATCPVKRGDKAEFTKGRTVVTGTVKSVNDKTVTLVDCDDLSEGYRVPFRLIRPSAKGAKAAPAQAPAATGIRVGAAASYVDEGRTVTGVVTSMTSAGAEVYGGNRWGRPVTVALGLLTAAPKRGEGVIMSDILAMYSNLSPENLHCDGEISRAEAGRRAVVFNRILRALFVEIGREVPEHEAYGYKTGRK
jgi:hypothetical protein